jgi:hypothetical protein
VLLHHLGLMGRHDPQRSSESLIDVSRASHTVAKLEIPPERGPRWHVRIVQRKWHTAGTYHTIAHQARAHPAGLPHRVNWIQHDAPVASSVFELHTSDRTGEHKAGAYGSTQERGLCNVERSSCDIEQGMSRLGHDCRCAPDGKCGGSSATRDLAPNIASERIRKAL